MRFPVAHELDSFPVIADFAVTLRDSHQGGRHVELTSASRGRLAGFPAWDHADRDLRHFTPADVPLGTLIDAYNPVTPLAGTDP